VLVQEVDISHEAETGTVLLNERVDEGKRCRARKGGRVQMTLIEGII